MSKRFTKHFHSREFDSPDLKDSGMLMKYYFIKKLEKLRITLNRPMIITSGYRTEKHNLEVGGIEGSSHTKGIAVDVAYSNSFELYSLLFNALRMGFWRIGVSKNMVHLDVDTDKPQGVFWLYD